MAETILSRAIRGLGSSLRFTGSREGPPGIDLSRASTPVNDLTQYARYGSALVFNQLQDGWVTATFQQETTEAGFSSQAETWDTQVSGDFGIAANALRGMMLWVYAVSQGFSVNTTVTDVGASRLTISLEKGIGDVVTGIASHVLWLDDGGGGINFIPMAALSGALIKLVSFPQQFPCGAGDRG